jgi:glycosyltransferase involved in cell wall biosynthesis
MPVRVGLLKNKLNHLIMTSGPLVSAIIPTYNRADVVCRAIDSVLAQTYRNREIIVVDDGSSDDTQSKLAAYGSQITVITQKNSGPSKARNLGVALSRGEIIAFLDSDDYWLPTKLERQVELLEKGGPQVPCCLCNCAYTGGTWDSTFEVADITSDHSAGLWLNPAQVLSTRFVVFTQAAAIRRQALEQVGAFDDDALPFYCEDYDLALRLALIGPWGVITDKLVVCQEARQDSLGERALRDIIRLRTDQLHVRKRFASLVASDPTHAELQPQAARELRRAERALQEARLSKLNTTASDVAAWLLRFRDRLGQTIFRRTPSYPRVVLKPLI